MIKAFIFDIDGTLMDSNDAHAQSFVETFNKYGKDVSLDELKCLIGMGADDILKKYLNQKEFEKYGEEMKKFRSRLFLKKYLPDVKVFPKVRELFERIKRDGKQIVLASSAKSDELEKYLEKLKISDLIADETSSSDVEDSKPEPDIFQAAFKKLKNVKKEEVLVVGDTPYDAEAAAKAGLKIIGVTSGGWTIEKLLNEGCARVYQNISEIYQNYEKPELQ